MSLIRNAIAVLVATVASITGAAWIAKLRLPVHDGHDDDDIALVSIFEGSALRPVSHAFRGGTIHTVMGGTNLDLRRTELDPGGGVLEVTTVYGGTDITVPDSWLITVDRTTVIGGTRIDVRLPDELEDRAPHLVIRACTVFGGLSVTARPVLRPAEAAL
jgi:hypothetical protein